tara:strand:- start:1603 stop:1884 length:282 start_codon:yes stop_codon:yes gene_type:complete
MKNLCPHRRGFTIVELLTVVMFFFVAAIIGALIFWLLPMCFDYSLNALFGKDVSYWLDVLGGFFLCPITVPGSVVLLIAENCGVVFPLLVDSS